MLTMNTVVWKLYLTFRNGPPHLLRNGCLDIPWAGTPNNRDISTHLRRSLGAFPDEKLEVTIVHTKAAEGQGG